MESNDGKDRDHVGRLIADRYQVEQLQREDASSVSVVAKHLNLDELVVVHFLRPQVRLDARASARYSRATRALVRIKTDHAVRVLDVGTSLSIGPYMVLEHLAGMTLAERLRSDGKLPIARAVDYVLQACKGLAVAHAAGLVHGQLSPESLFLARQAEFETLKLVDFPTGASAEPPAPAVAQYMAPEALQPSSDAVGPESEGSELDRRADVWSLGVVLYELVTGRPAFDSVRQVGSTAGAPADLTLSPTLRWIIGRCLQPERSQRFQSVDELAAELLPLTTMTEVFRGSLTGSFSRQMLMAAAAQARAAKPGQHFGGAASGRSLAARRVPRRPIVQSEALFARILTALSDESLGRVQERWAERWQAWTERTRRVLPGTALEQFAVASGTVLLVAFGAARLGSIHLVPPPPQQRAPVRAAEPRALPVTTTLAAIAPAEASPSPAALDAALAAPLQRSWGLLPKAPDHPAGAARASTAAPPAPSAVPAAPEQPKMPRAQPGKRSVKGGGKKSARRATVKRSRGTARLEKPAVPARQRR